MFACVRVHGFSPNRRCLDKTDITPIHLRFRGGTCLARPPLRTATNDRFQTPGESPSTFVVTRREKLELMEGRTWGLTVGQMGRTRALTSVNEHWLDLNSSLSPFAAGAERGKGPVCECVSVREKE